MKMLVCSVQIISRLDSQVPDVFWREWSVVSVQYGAVFERGP